MVTCSHCFAESTEAHHARIVHNQLELHGPWLGWRLAGRDLVAPDGQRLPPQRLRGLLWREQMELRRAGFTSRRKAEKGIRHGAQVKVVIVDLADWQAQHFGSRAG